MAGPAAGLAGRAVANAPLNGSATALAIAATLPRKLRRFDFAIRGMLRSSPASIFLLKLLERSRQSKTENIAADGHRNVLPACDRVSHGRSCHVLANVEMP